MKHLYTVNNQSGYLTLITAALIVIVGFIAVTLSYIIFGNAFGTLNLQQATAALYIAESGLEDATHELNAFTLTNRSACSGLNITNPSIGNGTYTVTSTGPFYVSSPTTLNGAITANANSIPVVSTANYQTSGRIIIDQELVNYAGKDATNFLFVQRGVDGTAATSHVTNAPVGQYQCGLISTGGIPTLTFTSGAPGGKRILNEAIQLQEAWAVGNQASGSFTLMRWNRPTEMSWNNSSSAGSFNLNSVSMISYVDGWAVGASTNFLHWNGSTWNTLPSGLPNVTYNEIFCIANNNCHVVGNVLGGNPNVPSIADWNGVVWTPTSLNAGTNVGNQFSIHCASANDCWSVGDQGKNSSFYHWNGAAWSASVVTGSAGGDFPFRGVFCTSSSNCWAVGTSGNFARWNGSTWSMVATGTPTAQHNGIYCNNASDCWVVGNVNGGTDMLLHWNGTAWSHDTSHPTPTTNLNSVSCANTNDCWAVGAANGGQPSFLHWNGSSWTKIATTSFPNVPANAISMISSNTQPWNNWTENFS